MFHDINEKLDRIEDKLGDRLNNHSKRIRSLENWRAYLVGAWAILAGVLLVSWEYAKAKVLR